MDNQMTWNVYNLVRTVPDGVVVMVCCTVSMVDGQYKASGNVDQKVPYKSPSDPGFIPFDQLTEAETIEWVQQQLGPEKINAMRVGLLQSIARQQVQTAQGVPW
jgi:hypothetical protein